MIDVRHVPQLHDPLVIAAFAGWNDAGESASSAVDHLIDAWGAELVASLDPEEYYDFQVNRPRVAVVEGRRLLEWPTTQLFLARDTPLGRDVLLVRGIEPSIRWRSYVAELISFARTHGVTLMVTLGGLLADVPHSRPIPVSVTSEDPDLREQHQIERSNYEGPSGIVGVLAEESMGVQIPTLSVWAAVPHYAGGPPSPKAALAIVSRLEELLGCVIDEGDLTELARAWEHGVDELASSDDEVKEYVAALEDAQDTADLPEASGDAIAKEFEKYLRRRGSDPGQ